MLSVCTREKNYGKMEIRILESMYFIVQYFEGSTEKILMTLQKVDKSPFSYFQFDC